MTIRFNTDDSMPDGKSKNPFVGRATEIGIIGDAINGVRDGQGSVLLFAGEPGIGKSTLARTSADLAKSEGIAVYWGFSWEAGGAPAYWPWTQLLRSLVGEREVSAERVRPLAQVLPEVATGDSSQPELQPDQARFQLLEAVRALLATLGSASPFVLILEDLHAADSDSLHLLHYIARHAASLPVLIIGTYRVVEARSKADTEALWRTSRDATVLELSHLGESDIRDFLALIGGDASDEEAVQRLFSTTAGNPLFLTELVGLLSDKEATSTGTPLPETVQQVIRQQIALLPEDTVSTLASAAVIGREFGLPELATLMCLEETAVSEHLQPAIEATFLRALNNGKYRFAHTLYRDVLYQDLDATEREALHLRYAGLLQELIDAGDADRWFALATHLQSAGPEHRLDSIEALRNAAVRSQARLAFEDAASLLHQALDAFGTGPKYEPVQRCRLLVDYASALMITGQIEAGQEHCEEAFAIAKTVGDAVLMSDVALAWGSAIVVGKVDPSLIAALEQCLTALPSNDAATRSRVQARLAGAMQPSLNPVEPMAMAREAVALARETGDERVLYTVLRFAISALMDFAPAIERIELNREFGSMAAAFGDVPQQFRSNLLLMVDYSETGDRNGLDEAIRECCRLADRIGLPHYQWRAYSARAMQATIAGDFDRACDLLDSAEAVAGRIEDLQANLTLSLQRFALLIEWDSSRVTPLDQIEARLQAGYAGGIGEAEFFITPFLAIYKRGDDVAFAKKFIANEMLVDRTFAGSDRYSLAGLGVMAMKAGDLALAARCHDALVEFSDSCATIGLLGSCWCGPVAYWLAMLAHGLGRFEDAASYADKALEIAGRMGARPYTARIHAIAAEIARSAGNEELAADCADKATALMQELGLRPERRVPTEPSGPPATPAAAGIAMRQDGDVWIVEYGTKTATVRDARGLHMLAELIARPGADIHVLDLSGTREAAQEGDSGPMLDTQARDDYRRRVGELREELDEAESLADLGRADKLRSEIEFITRELSRAFGLGGRQRAAGDAAERARVNVRRRIKDAVERIGKQAPEAGRYLENTIKTGRYCRYSPM
ncbi:MAG: ATP-binding protein [Woeseiaceae bacterium]